jgi:hypothetical protein
MRLKHFHLLSFGIALAFAASTAPVHAQYDFWAGQIDNAQQAQISTISTHVDNLILQDVIDQQPRSGKSTKSQNNSKSLLSGNTASATAVRNSVVKSLIDQTRRGDAEAGRQMEAMFTTGGFVQSIESALRSYGMKPNNLADAYSVWMVNMYSAARGDETPTSPATMKAVRDQVARSFASMPEFISAPDAKKQVLSDELLFRGAIIGGSLSSFTKGSDLRNEFIDNVRQTSKKSGFDVDTVSLTEEGFVPAKGRKGADASDAIEDSEKSFVAADASEPKGDDNDNTTSYALIAGVAGAGIGMAFLIGKAKGKKG